MNKLEQIWEDNFNLIYTDGHGVFIPQLFARGMRDTVFEQQSDSVKEAITNLKKEDSNEDEFYWEDWETILNGYVWKDSDCKYSLYQNGDLWQINDTYLESLPDVEIDALWEYIA